jgi:hypothetical protein
MSSRNNSHHSRRRSSLPMAIPSSNAFGFAMDIPNPSIAAAPLICRSCPMPPASPTTRPLTTPSVDISPMKLSPPVVTTNSLPAQLFAISPFAAHRSGQHTLLPPSSPNSEGSTTTILDFLQERSPGVSASHSPVGEFEDYLSKSLQIDGDFAVEDVIEFS